MSVAVSDNGGAVADLSCSLLYADGA